MILIYSFLFTKFLIVKFTSSAHSIPQRCLPFLMIFISLFLIIYFGENAGAFLFTIYIMTSIVISLTQPAIALNFSKNLAGKSLTSYNVFLFSGTFFIQWGIGLVIDLCNNKGFDIVSSYRISFSVFLILCVLSYIFFIYLNKNEN